MTNSMSPEELRSIAADFEHDNYCEGDEGYCPSDEANWERVEAFPVSALLHLNDDWHQWFKAELEMNEQDNMGREWPALVKEDIRDEIVVLMRDGKGYIWDGWHRVGAVIASGREYIPAIVGIPLAELDARADAGSSFKM